MTRATIQGVSFEGDESERGFGLDLEGGFLGWDDAPDMRHDEHALVTAHGAFDVPGFLSPRVISFSGLCITSSPEEQQLYRNRLMGIAADGDKRRLEVDHGGTTLWADVRRSGSPQFRIASYGEVAHYQIEFWAADPRKFGETQSFTALANNAVDVWHWGNFGASPVVVVDGYMPSGTYAVEAFGRRFHVSRPLLPGHPHTLNFAGGQLLVDGAVTVGGVLEADAWTVPGGSKVGHYLNMPSGYGQMTVKLTDTYI